MHTRSIYIYIYLFIHLSLYVCKIYVDRGLYDQGRVSGYVALNLYFLNSATVRGHSLLMFIRTPISATKIKSPVHPVMSGFGPKGSTPSKPRLI